MRRDCTPMDRMGPRASMLLLLLLPLRVGLGGLAAQETQSGYTNLTIDELMDLDVLKINALGTHTHLAGEWMTGYRFMAMKMTGNRDGTQDIQSGDVLEDFMVAPTSMRMQMHMFELMYAPSDDLTLMAMVPYHQRSMKHLTRADMGFMTESEGVGDLVLEALYAVRGDVRRDRHRLLLNARVSLPTGRIDRKGDTPMAAAAQLPYPMQVGSGTVDVVPGVTYVGESSRWAWMVQTRGTVRTGKNDRGYALGNQVANTLWLAWALA